ncbi:MAG: GNAT family N-acetyltransferase [Ruminiclostridium sp.]
MEQTFKFIYSGKMHKTPIFSKERLYLATHADKEELEGLNFFEGNEVERFIEEPSIYIYRINVEYICRGTFLKPYWRKDISDIEKNKYRDIGMHVSEKYRGRGFGRSIVQNLTIMSIENGFIPITECEIKNAASRATLESAGYILEAIK